MPFSRRSFAHSRPWAAMLIPALLLLVFALLPLPAMAEPASPPASSQPAPLRVLFIGNSYTYYNDLPAMLTNMAAASPQPILADAVTEPGATLQLLWDEGKALKKIRSQPWDFVILQEQSLRPTTDPELMRRYARKFDAAIREKGARTVFYLTWARLNKPEMQDVLDRAYSELAKELGALLAPVGPAWKRALEKTPKLPLHLEDGSHPTPTGSYLAACVLYLTLAEGQKSCPAFEDPAIPPAHANLVREAAAQTIEASPISAKP